MADEESEKISSDSDIHLDQNQAAENYDKICNDYNDVEVERANNLNNMQKIISRLKKKGNTTVGTQTDSVKGMKIKPLEVPKEAKITGEIELKSTTPILETQISESPGIRNNSVLSVTTPTRYQNSPQPSQHQYYAKPNLMLQHDADKLSDLNLRLNILLATPVKKLKIKDKKANKNQEAGLDLFQDGKYMWVTPQMILLFLHNTINDCAPIGSDHSPHLLSSKEEMKIRIPAWQDFKQIIYEIYDHRIAHSAEISGCLNNTYLGMDEHLILYFAQVHKNRFDIEKNIIQFLASLKYFVSKDWPRAIMYAKLTGFLQVNDIYETVPTPSVR